MTDHTASDRMILSIAGSDPGGGAGVQADLKTCAVLGVYSGAAITCVTVQNTRGVRSFTPLPPKLVAAQIKVVLSDMPVSHVKIGMIGTAAIAEAIADSLAGFSGEIVIDPVLASSAGTPFMKEDELERIIEHLFARATVLTPNLPELEILSGMRCKDENSLQGAAEQLFRTFPTLRALAVKGGHLAPEGETVTDYLFLSPHLHTGEPRTSICRHPRIATPNTHGTGCTFASAYAAFHLKTGSDHQAFELASDFVGRLVAKSSTARLGSGNGPLLHHLPAAKGE